MTIFNYIFRKQILFTFLQKLIHFIEVIIFQLFISQKFKK